MKQRRLTHTIECSDLSALALLASSRIKIVLDTLELDDEVMDALESLDVLTAIAHLSHARVLPTPESNENSHDRTPSTRHQ